ncbi:hypothetical protein ACFWCA_19505 [Streptomyces phaeochromogenes]|uniref:hypothetical protein n=1 Tax=Streptomyces phaeochromogenes TaxID=1923 RepID=UPI003677BBB0
MTRYGFAIKALPPGGKPFGEEDDENEETEEAEGTEETPFGKTNPSVSDTDPAEDSEDELPEAPPLAPAAPGENPSTVEEDPAAPPDPNAPAEGGGGGGAPEQSEGDSRPWAGDEYNEGDETDPEGPEAWAAYSGSGGEQAWLDKGPDGTLTGWIRDGDGQVWRYTDPDAWSTDVDGAQMTQTHHNGEDRAGVAGGEAPTSPPATDDRGVQDLMFAGQ